MGTTLRQTYKSIYWAWKSMKQRCQNPKCSAYPNYGARGIKVCGEWQKFEPFLEWALANGWKKGLELDRIDNDGNYCAENCRWLERRKNINNRRKTVVLNVDGVELPITEWAERLGVDRALLRSWLTGHGEEYVAERVRGIIANGYVPRDFGYSHRRAVRHVDSGRIFKSCSEAAAHYGVSAGSLSVAIRKGIVTKNGRFEYIDTK